MAACTKATVEHAAVPTPSTSTTAAAAAAGASGCGARHAPGQSVQAFDFEGKSRSYQLYVPRGYGGSTPEPVVFDFHGYGSNAAQQMAYGDFRPLADRDNFLIVAPDGQGLARHFNLSGEGGLQDDVAMVSALLDHIEGTFCVDPARVYATGMSDGGAMSSVLACKSSDRFAAFGPVAVILYFPGCGGQRNVSIAGFMGTADPVVPFNGGRVSCCGNADVGAAPDAMAGWAAHDGCNKAFADERLGSEVRKRTWPGCGGASSVVFYIIDGGGHTWPGAIQLPAGRFGLTTMQIKASDTIWDFFKAHPRNS